MTIRNALAAAAIAATAVLPGLGAAPAHAACEPNPVIDPGFCDGVLPDGPPRCWHEPSTHRIWCEW